MSLYKQLWMAVVALMVLVFGGSLYVTSLSAKHYLEEQLFMKNSDNAAALALSLTQQDADEVLLELTLSAQFDTGHYELIQLTSPDNEVLIKREDIQPATGAPNWFTNLFPIEVKSGLAQIQNGWNQIGMIEVRSHTRFAYQELWQNSKKLALVFLIGMTLAGTMGSMLLRVILRPLSQVVSQAEAIGERRFITIPEPRTLEFKRLVSSMNMMSARIKSMLRQEADRLDKWRAESYIDKVTGLLNREQFMQTLGSWLERDDASANGVLTLVRLQGLAELNKSQGRKVVDGVLSDIGSGLKALASEQSEWVTGRLNGSDLALLAKGGTEPGVIGRSVQQIVEEALVIREIEGELKLPGAACVYSHGDTIADVMTQLDAALQASEAEGESSMVAVVSSDLRALPVREELEVWRGVFTQAFKENSFSLASYQVSDLTGQALHIEAPVRLNKNDTLLSAGQFLPWINRLEMAEDLDKTVIGLALDEIKKTGRQTCVNLSYSSVASSNFMGWLTKTLAQHPAEAKSLWLEVQESMAYRYLDNFRLLCTAVKYAGAKLGIEHVGHQLSDLGRLHDVGIDYIKVDAAFIRDISVNATNQTLLRTLCTLGHSLGVLVIAEGVKTSDEWNALAGLGIDGATGPQVSRQVTLQD